MPARLGTGERLVRNARRYAIAIPLLVGIIALLGATQLRGDWATVLYGVGTSLIAAAVFARFALVSDELSDELMRLGVQDVFADRRKALRDEFWEKLIRGSRHHYFVLGVANNGYAGDQPRRDRYKPAFLEAVRQRVEVTIIWLDPETDIARIRDAEEQRATRKDTVDSILWFWGLAQELNDSERARFKLLLHQDTPTCGVTWADDRVVVTNYLAGRLNLEAPGMILSTATTRWSGVHRLLGVTPSEAELATSYTNNLREVEGRSEVIDQHRITRLKSLRPAYATGPSQADIRKERDAAEHGGSS